MLEPMRTHLLRSDEALERAIKATLDTARERFAGQCVGLEALNPLAVLRRGYAVVSKGGKTVTDAKEVQEGDLLSVRLSNGAISARAMTREGMEE